MIIYRTRNVIILYIVCCFEKCIFRIIYPKYNFAFFGGRVFEEI